MDVQYAAELPSSCESAIGWTWSDWSWVKQPW